MFVMGTQGERIGKVIRCDVDTFVVEKGVFFPKDYELRYDHITDVSGGTVRYALTDFLRGRDIETAASKPATAAQEAAATAATAAAPVAAAATATATARRAEKSQGREEIRIPLMHEEIDIEKVARESGHIRIHKTVHTEEKHFSVPVTREEVIIEHVAIGRDAALTGDDAFIEDTVDVPLYEEEVRVSKHSVLDEEVVVRTVAQSVEREGTAMLRHEEAEVEDTRRKTGLSAVASDYGALRRSGRAPLTPARAQSRTTDKRRRHVDVLGAAISSRRWWGRSSPSGSGSEVAFPDVTSRHTSRRRWRALCSPAACCMRSHQRAGVQHVGHHGASPIRNARPRDSRRSRSDWR